MSEAQHPLTEAVEWTRLDDRRFEHAFDARWANGPTVFAGTTVAALVRQMQRVLDESDRPVWTLDLHLSGKLPVDKTTTMTVDVVRQGRTTAHMRARIDYDDQTRATATATFGRCLEERPRFEHLEAPHYGSPDDHDLLPDSAVWAEAFQHFDYRIAEGDYPFTGSDHAISGGWMNFTDPVDRDAAAVGCLMDAWAPSIFTTYSTFRPTITVDMRVEYFTDFSKVEQSDKPFQYTGETDHAGDGYAREDRMLWSADGRPVARARELFIVLD